MSTTVLSKAVSGGTEGFPGIRVQEENTPGSSGPAIQCENNRAASNSSASSRGQNDQGGPMFTADGEAIEAFRHVLETNRYTEAGLREALGPDMSQQLLRTDIPLYLRRLSAPSSLNTLLKLFTLHVWVDEEAARAALAPLALERAVALGLMEVAGKGAHARVGISLCDGLWLVHDYAADEQQGMHPEHVLGTNPAAFTLANLTVRRPARLALDVGTGCGVQALLAARHSEYVIAVDTNPRALSYASFNARLNRLNNVECRLGSLFEPVKGCEFDLIVCNPPFVISPESHYMFRDSGLPGDKLSEQVVRAVPGYLSEGGFASVLCSWTHGKDEDSSVRLRQWVENDGCDACLLRGVTRDPLGYAATWNRGRNQAVYGHSLDSWQAYYRQLGIQALSMGSVVLRRRSTGRNWVRTDDMPASFVSSCSEHLLRMVQAEDYLAEHGNGVNLLAQTFQLVDDHRLNQSSAFRQGKLVIEKMELELTRGLRTHGAVDASALQVLARCDGRRTLGQVVAELAQFAKSDPQEIERQASALVRQLVSFGFLVPVGGEAASESNPPIGGPGIDAESTQN